MYYENSARIMGCLGQDPEIRSFANGGKVANLRIATTRRWKDRNSGERRERTEWHRVVIFNENLVRLCENYLRKGSKIYLEGSIETRKWSDQGGQERYTTEIVLRPYRGELTMLDGRGGGEGMGSEGGGGGGGGGGFSSGPPDVEPLDDDIPF